MSAYPAAKAAYLLCRLLLLLLLLLAAPSAAATALSTTARHVVVEQGLGLNKSNSEKYLQQLLLEQESMSLSNNLLHNPNCCWCDQVLGRV